MLPRRPFPPMPSRNFPMQPFFQQQPMMMNRSSGGLLSRLFGGRAQSIPNMTNASRMGSLLGNVQNVTNPSSISSMMTNVQKILKVAESVGPMVQQYGPVVKNIPAMFKIYKALKSDDTSEEETEAIETASEEVNDGNPFDEDTFNELEAEFIESPRKGASKPKLYI
ncbi:VrrA/YqfQ family protein [Priestia abyssalis]|uniref:VrrA/YqfQ family protein n=1 Tax=Priestia abyssalis TaxID=1221450 RepID=UPI001473E09C|nr:VrrA/YqfQ family protein [Priestia abyssalis]